MIWSLIVRLAPKSRMSGMRMRSELLSDDYNDGLMAVVKEHGCDLGQASAPIPFPEAAQSLPSAY